MLFLFHDPATTEIYTLSLHDALPIFDSRGNGLSAESRGIHGDACGSLTARDGSSGDRPIVGWHEAFRSTSYGRDRKSTRLNSSHGYISYAVFCLKKKKLENKKALIDT